MKQLTLNGSLRQNKGRSGCRSIRAQGCTPAVVYGSSGVKNITIKNSDLCRLFSEMDGGAALIEIDFKTEKILTLIQEVQNDPISRTCLHVDFKEVVRGKEIRTTVPLHFSGESYGEKNEGAVVEQSIHEVELKARPRNLPSNVNVDLSNLKSGESIHISDLPQLEGVTYLGDPEIVLASCSVPSSGSVDDADTVATEEIASV